MRSHTRRFAGMSNWHLLNYGVGTSCIANCGKGSSGKQPRPKFQSWLELRDCWEECDRLRSVKLKFETTFGLVWPICSARNFPSCFENGEANAFAVLHHMALHSSRKQWNNKSIMILSPSCLRTWHWPIILFAPRMNDQSRMVSEGSKLCVGTVSWFQFFCS